MQVVILAGGLGTRLGNLTARVPKSMVAIGGRPFLEHQLELLKGLDVTHVLLCIGHLGDQIRRYFGDGSKWGISLTYSDEGEVLLGTAGALKQAESLLQDPFCVTYGDSYLPVDYRSLMSRFLASNRLAMMVVYENHGQYDASNVVLDGELVKVYAKGVCLPGMVYIDAGVTAIRKEALKLVPAGRPCTLELLLQRLVQMGQLAAYETAQRFYQIGSPQGLEEFRKLVAGEVVV